MRRFSVKAPLSLIAVGAAPSALAQVCYEHDHQCFSPAPIAEEIGSVASELGLRSESLSITGDFRLRARAADTASDAPYNENDQQATRGRIALDYRVNESTRVFAEYNFSETWAGSEPYSDARPTNPVNELSQLYVQTEGILGVEDTWRVGRSTYVLNNGLILGSCDFLQYPSTFTGIWASTQVGEHAFEIFAFDNYGQLNLQPGMRFVGGTAHLDVGEGEIVESIDPFILLGTNDGDGGSDDSWYGLSTGGVLPAEIDWDLEVAQRSVDGGDDRFAYRASAKKEFDGFLESVSLTRTGSEGAMHVNPADFNSAGLVHQYGGAWRSDIETNQLAVSLAPGGDVDLDLNILNFDGDNATQGEFEVDIMAGKPLTEGVHGWVGYGRDDEDREVLYVQLTVFF